MNMDRKTLNTMIPILAVVIFFIWGWIEGSYRHSWLVFVIAGGAMAVILAMNKNKEKETEETKPAKQEDNR